MDLYK